MGRLFSVREAADALCVSEKTVRRLLDDGQLPYTRLGFGRGVIRIPAAALERFVNDRIETRAAVR